MDILEVEVVECFDALGSSAGDDVEARPFRRSRGGGVRAAGRWWSSVGDRDGDEAVHLELGLRGFW